MCDGLGTDIVSVPRIAALVGNRGDAFLHRWFTSEEIAYCSSKAEPSRHFAARLAAKEAVVKALPTPWRGPLPWRSIEIARDMNGKPVVRLSGEFGVVARRSGVRIVRVSLSHCDEYATAVASASLGTGSEEGGGSGGAHRD
jgi:holo-[acyl-carrier protein] synthase